MLVPCSWLRVAQTCMLSLPLSLATEQSGPGWFLPTPSVPTLVFCQLCCVLWVSGFLSVIPHKLAIL